MALTSRRTGPDAYLRLKRRQWQFTKRHNGTRIIKNLGTSDLLEARKLRDKLLLKLAKGHLLDDPNDPLVHRQHLETITDPEQRANLELVLADVAEDRGLGVDWYRIATGQTAATPIDNHLERFFAEVPCEPITEQARRTAITRFQQTTGHRTIEAVTRKIAGAYVSKLAEKRLKPATINSQVSHVSRYWQWLVRKDFAASNPWEKQSVPKTTRKGREKPELDWTTDEVHALLRAAPDQLTKDVILTLCLTGCRIGEIAELIRSEVGERSFRITEAKSQAGVRTIYIEAESLAETLTRLCKGAGPDDLLFGRGVMRPTRDPLNPRSKLFIKKIGRWLRSLQPGKSKGERKTLHGLRKTFSTAAERQGVPPHLIAVAAGHEREGVTLSVYSHGPSEQQVREVFAAVARELGFDRKL